MIDAIIYTDGTADLSVYAERTPVFTTNGHSVVLVRFTGEPQVLVGAEILATGLGWVDNPFSKLEGEALAKYRLAYPGTRVDLIDGVDVVTELPIECGMFA